MNRITVFRIITALMLFVAVSEAISQNIPGSRSSQNKLSAEKWAEDIDYFVNEMPKIHIAPYKNTSKENLELYSEVLKSRLKNMNDNEALCEIAKMTAMIGDGHTALNIFNFHISANKESYKLNVFPLKMYQFSDGMYVTASAPQYNELIACKVIKINGKAIEDVIEIVKPIVPCDNEYSQKFNLPYYMVIAEFMNGLGITTNPYEMELTVIDKNGSEKYIKLDAIEISRMQHNSVASDNNGLPLYMKNEEKNYWFEYLNENKTLYINYKRVLNDPEDSLKHFCKRLEEFINSNDIEKTVIDIRNNSGGNNATCQPFVNLISNNKRINRKGKLFVIIGKQTFSAASYLTTKLEFNTKAIFAGEPTGASPNHYGDNRPLILPNSKLEVRLSSIFWQNSFPVDNRKATEPHIKIELSSADYFSGKDPVLDAVLNYSYEGHTSGGVNKNVKGIYSYSPIQSLEITEEAGAMKMKVMQMDFVGRNVSFISTGLYPEAGGSLSTDIAGLKIIPANKDLKINYMGNEWVIKRYEGVFKTPQHLLDEGKNEEAADLLRAAKINNPSYQGLNENIINGIGYYALGKKNFDGAIKIFSLNCDLYPQSWNVYDSLGEAYLLSGNTLAAIENYKRSVELNPDNKNGKKIIENLTK
ncbi:MAG: hypothetical protein J0M37_05370 [Ignavibacteria bacterium]|nr:hypothetical protein [Ignavibacteria bacterium]